MDQDPPLGEEALDLYEAYLMSDRTPESCMDISTLDGFLTAIVSGPGNLSPSHWLRHVWDQERGEEEPDFEDRAEMQRVLGWLMQHVNAISDSLRADAFEPLFYERNHEGRAVRIIDEWCTGYLKAVELDHDLWEPLLQAQPDVLRPIRLYGTDEGFRELENESQSLEAHEARTTEVEDAVRAVNAFWTGRRRDLLAPPEALRVEKTGRNEPCPCGSGAKYKRCHGR